MDKCMLPGIVILVLLVLIVGWFNSWPSPLFIDRVEVYTYDHTKAGSVELTTVESIVAMGLSYLGLCAGEVDAEPCCDGYRLEVYYLGGTRVSYAEGAKGYMICRRPMIGGQFFVWNPLLEGYIRFLQNVYELPDPWAN